MFTVTPWGGGVGGGDFFAKVSCNWSFFWPKWSLWTFKCSHHLHFFSLFLHILQKVWNTSWWIFEEPLFHEHLPSGCCVCTCARVWREQPLLEGLAELPAFFPSLQTLGSAATHPSLFSVATDQPEVSTPKKKTSHNLERVAAAAT